MPAVDDPEDAAALAGLRYVATDEPGLRRLRCGRGFRYLTDDGRRCAEPDVARARALAIPPAWTEVWICADPDGHVQAVGRDAAGRKQYRYHDAWTEIRGQDKFAALATFGRRLPRVRAALDRDLGRPGLSRERVLALVVQLLDDTSVRIGNRAYAAQGSYGLTTLESEHIEVTPDGVQVEFVGKHQIVNRFEIDDPRLVGVVEACEQAGGERLFTYEDDDGQLHDVTSDEVNAYLRGLAGAPVSARDFRTWGATTTAVAALGPHPVEDSEAERRRRFLDALDQAAERLGNTRAVVRSAYVHPDIELAYRDGSLHEAWRRSRRGRWSDRAEGATLRVIDPRR